MKSNVEGRRMVNTDKFYASRVVQVQENTCFIAFDYTIEMIVVNAWNRYVNLQDSQTTRRRWASACANAHRMCECDRNTTSTCDICCQEIAIELIIVFVRHLKYIIYLLFDWDFVTAVPFIDTSIKLKPLRLKKKIKLFTEQSTLVLIKLCLQISESKWYFTIAIYKFKLFEKGMEF